MSAVKERAGRNRTLCLSPGQQSSLLGRCLPEGHVQGAAEIADKIIYGDFFNIAPELPSKSVDLLIADPPYNLGKKYATGEFRKMGAGEYEGFTRKWLEASLHTLKCTASVYVCCDWRTSMIVGSVLGEYLTIRNRITWQREKGRGALRNWKNSMEDIWFATVSKSYTFNVGAVKQRRKVIAPYRVDGRPKGWQETEDGGFRDTHPSNFWDDISVPYWSMPENTDHPTQKPEKLFAKLVLASSNEGDLILDPFAGAGTSSVVAKKLGRQYIGVEKEALYCALAEMRLELAGSDSSIQGYEDNVFWERNTLAGRKR